MSHIVCFRSFDFSFFVSVFLLFFLLFFVGRFVFVFVSMALGICTHAYSYSQKKSSVIILHSTLFEKTKTIIQPQCNTFCELITISMFHICFVLVQLSVTRVNASLLSNN